jgi:hypothetical protein
MTGGNNSGNSRNSKTTKALQGDFGDWGWRRCGIEMGRSSIKSEPKCRPARVFDDKIISMYERGNEHALNHRHLEEISGVE